MADMIPTDVAQMLTGLASTRTPTAAMLSMHAGTYEVARNQKEGERGVTVGLAYWKLIGFENEADPLQEKVFTVKCQISALHLGKALGVALIVEQRPVERSSESGRIDCFWLSAKDVIDCEETGRGAYLNWSEKQLSPMMHWYAEPNNGPRLNAGPCGPLPIPKSICTIHENLFPSKEDIVIVSIYNVYGPDLPGVIAQRTSAHSAGTQEETAEPIPLASGRQPLKWLWELGKSKGCRIAFSWTSRGAASADDFEPAAIAYGGNQLADSSGTQKNALNVRNSSNVQDSSNANCSEMQENPSTLNMADAGHRSSPVKKRKRANEDVPTVNKRPRGPKQPEPAKDKLAWFGEGDQDDEEVLNICHRCKYKMIHCQCAFGGIPQDNTANTTAVAKRQADKIVKCEGCNKALASCECSRRAAMPPKTPQSAAKVVKCERCNKFFVDCYCSPPTPRTETAGGLVALSNMEKGRVDNNPFALALRGWQSKQAAATKRTTSSGLSSGMNGKASTTAKTSPLKAVAVPPTDAQVGREDSEDEEDVKDELRAIELRRKLRAIEKRKRAADQK
ncbi:hypothetical protein LTS10_010573 [Elasticomyces elasticus]|nr:hypothetical protein LTS10_010573 [Elasticomyces elasticus]